MKTLRRTVIIRDSDLDRMIKKTVKLYDRFEITPMTYQQIQNENVVAVLKGEQIPKFRTLPDLYENMLWREHTLYDRRYLKWHLTMDYPAGQIYVQSTSRTKPEPLHHVIFERDY